MREKIKGRGDGRLGGKRGEIGRIICIKGF